MTRLHRYALLSNELNAFNSEGDIPPLVFRHNRLNPPARRGLRVPTTLLDGQPVYIFDAMAFPVDAHLPALYATSHHPASTYTYKILTEDDRIPDEPLPLHISDAVMLSVAIDTYRELVSAASTLIDIRSHITHASAVVGINSFLLFKALTDMGELDAVDLSAPSDTFSSEPQFSVMAREVRMAVQAARTRRDGSPGYFSMKDLVIPDAPGGYPTHCPVTGYPLDWGVPRGGSHFSPKVGLRKPALGYVPANVVLMSRVAKRLIDGSTSPAQLVHFLGEYPDVLPSVKAWLKA